MSQTRIRLTRADLYAKVWATPMRMLAKEFGMSDVGLAKVCRKHNIPVPPVGYWRRKETGYKVTRPLLPVAKDRAEHLDIYVRERLRPEFEELTRQVPPQVIVTPEISHPLALRSQRLGAGKTYGEVLREYELHPESKCADATGRPCGKQTLGLLQRRHVQIDQIKYIGKESNSLEEVEAGLEHSAESVYTEYYDRRRDEWQTRILPVLRKLPVTLLVKMSGLSSTTIKDSLAGRSRPYRKNQERLADIARKLGAI